MVYFIQGELTKRIKIGKTGNMDQRLETLQCGSPDVLRVLKVVSGPDANDRVYHARFAVEQIYREWFEPSDRLLAFIASLPVSTFDGLTYASLGVLRRDGTQKALATRAAKHQKTIRQERRRQSLIKRRDWQVTVSVPSIWDGLITMGDYIRAKTASR